MESRRTIGPGIALLAILTFAFPSFAYAAEVPLKKITLVYTSVSPSLLRYSLEKELGFFREEGLRPELVLVRGGGIAVRGLITGNFDYVIPTSIILDAAIKTRQPLKVILTSWMANYWIVGQPGILSIADLKGKTIGANPPGSITDVIIREVLKPHGLDPLKDVALVSIGASRERFAALVSGAVHAAILSPPLNFKAIEMGYRKLANAADYIKVPAGGLTTREEKILTDPGEIARVVRASYKGHRFLMTQREYILSKIRQIFGLSQSDAVQTYESILDESLPSGYHSEEASRAIISAMKQAANITDDIPPERVFDYRFVKRVEQELKGWTPQVSKR
jgi:NitT/TauT family transport system substrate-binding protein